MNIKQIQPKEIWSSDGNRFATKLKLLTFYGYEFNDGSGYVDYQLLDENNDVIYYATLMIPQEIVQQWGNDDNIIWNFIIQKLGLIKI
jgi:hypothetical protein